MILLSLLLFGGTLPSPDIDYPAEAAAVIAVEGWNGSGRGPTGELGQYQFTPATWKFYSSRPFFEAEGSWPAALAEQNRVFQRVMDDLASQLPRAGMPVSAYTLALAYHIGMPHVRKREISDSAVRYATAVQALYDLGENYLLTAPKLSP